MLREEEFAPVKNANGSTFDTPDSAKLLVLRLHSRWVVAAGGFLTHSVPLYSTGILILSSSAHDVTWLVFIQHLNDFVLLNYTIFSLNADKGCCFLQVWKSPLSVPTLEKTLRRFAGAEHSMHHARLHIRFAIDIE